MTAGEGIKKAGKGVKNVTDRVVDAVEGKVNEVTDIVQDALHRSGENIHKAAGQPETPQAKTSKAKKSPKE